MKRKLLYMTLLSSLTFSFIPGYVVSQNSELKEDCEKNIASPLSEPTSPKEPYSDPKQKSDIKENQEKDKQSDLKNEHKVRSAPKVRRVAPIEGC